MDAQQLQNLSDVFLVTEYSSAGNILAIVSLIISLVAFAASIFFFYHGQKLNQASENALNKLNERIGSIQGSVDGMFNKTLDAALSRERVATNSIDITSEALHELKQQLKDEIEQSSDDETKNISNFLAEFQEKIETFEEKIKSTQTQLKRLNETNEIVYGESETFLSAEDAIYGALTFLQRGSIKSIYQYLKSQGRTMTFHEILRSLTNLMDRGYITEVKREDGDSLYKVNW